PGGNCPARSRKWAVCLVPNPPPTGLARALHTAAAPPWANAEMGDRQPRPAVPPVAASHGIRSSPASVRANTRGHACSRGIGSCLFKRGDRSGITLVDRKPRISSGGLPGSGVLRGNLRNWRGSMVVQEIPSWPLSSAADRLYPLPAPPARLALVGL